VSGTPAVRVEGLSKRYTIGGRAEGYQTFRETVTTAVARPIKRLRRGSQASAPAPTIWALRDISFDLEEGAVLGIIGRNGAGKSTILKILARITEPSDGYAEIRGRVGSLLEVGTGFHPELTGRENIYLNGAILGMTKRDVEARFDEIVDFAEVSKFIDTPVKRFSSGMYLRLAFAVAAHMETEILLVDEVLAVGDAAFQRKCLGKMKDIGEGGRTVIFVSHDMTAISGLAPNTMLLDNGEVSFLGPTEETIARYGASQMTGRTALVDRADRRGDGVVTIESIGLLGPDGEPASAVPSGSGLTVVFEYRTEQLDMNPEDLVLDVRFTDVVGHPVVTLSTRFRPLPHGGPLGRSGTLYCDVPRLPLADDAYGVDIWLAYRGGLSDEVRGAARIELLPSNYFGTGHSPVRRKHGPLLLDHSWRVEPDARNEPGL
jgi:lipopolysaccharide transport system ATP-binding protein